MFAYTVAWCEAWTAPPLRAATIGPHRRAAPPPPRRCASPGGETGRPRVRHSSYCRLPASQRASQPPRAELADRTGRRCRNAPCRCFEMSRPFTSAAAWSWLRQFAAAVHRTHSRARASVHTAPGWRDESASTAPPRRFCIRWPDWFAACCSVPRQRDEPAACIPTLAWSVASTFRSPKIPISPCFMKFAHWD